MNFCYKCGILGYDYKICKAFVRVVVSNGGVMVPLFGRWLMAESVILFRAFMTKGITQLILGDMVMVELRNNRRCF